MTAALALGWAALYADRTVLYPLLTVIMAQMALSSTDAGFVTGSYFLTYLAMQIPAGILGDRYGMKPVLTSMYGLSAVGLAGLAIWGDHYIALLFFMALHGLGAGAYYPTSFSIVMQSTTMAGRGTAVTRLAVGMAAGLLVGLATGGFLYEWSGSYRLPLLVLCLPTTAMFFLFRRILPEVRGSGSPTWRQYRAILLDKDLWRINFVAFTSLYAFWVAVTWGPTFLKMERGFSLGASGFFTGLMAISAIPAALLWGKLSDRFGRKPVALLVLPSSALALFLFSQAHNQIALIILMLAFGMFANSAFVPIMAAWTGDIVEHRHPGLMGAAVGIFNCIIMSSAVVAPIVSGILRDKSGSLEPALLAGAVLIVLGTLVLSTLPQLRRA